MLSPIDKKLLRDLLHMKGQIVAVILVVAAGLASYVSMASVYDSLHLTRSAYYDRFRFGEIFASVKSAPEGVLRTIASIPGVASVRSRIVFDVTIDVPGLDEPATGRLVSMPEHHVPVLNDIHLRSGRYFEQGRPEEVIVSEAFAEANGLLPGSKIGAIINGRWKELRVVGIALSPEYIYELQGGASVLPDNRRFGIIWISREALGAAFNMDGAFNDLSLALSHGTRGADVIERLDLILERYGALGAYDRADQVSHHMLNDELVQLKANALYVPLIFLGVAAFLLNIVLTRLLSMQRDQVAVLKAFGYSNFTVGMHYVKFALVAVLLGAALGTLLGMWMGTALTGIYAQFYRFPFLRYVMEPAVVFSIGSTP